MQIECETQTKVEAALQVCILSWPPSDSSMAVCGKITLVRNAWYARWVVSCRKPYSSRICSTVMLRLSQTLQVAICDQITLVRNDMKGTWMGFFYVRNIWRWDGDYIGAKTNPDAEKHWTGRGWDWVENSGRENNKESSEVTNKETHTLCVFFFVVSN